MILRGRILILVVFVGAISCGAACAEGKPVVGLIPKAQKPIPMDGKLAGWDGAFVTPVHVGHPDFANRGAQFLYLWDEKNLYVGLRCLDQKPAHVGTDDQIWNGDAVEFYLDTRRGDKLGAAQFGPDTLHCFYTPFTKAEIKPRIGVRDLPAFKGFKLQGAEVAAEKTPWGWTAVFKLPWSNFPAFTPKAGEVIGLECELCSSDGGPRADRTFVYSGPAAVDSPAAFGRVRLVDKIEPEALKPLGRALLPLALTKSANYAWLYGTVCISPTIEKSVAKLEGQVIDGDGKVRKTSAGSRKTLDSGFVMWTGSWELFDLPQGAYSVELRALDKQGKVVTSRSVKMEHNHLALRDQSDQGFTVVIDDVGKHLKQADAPKRKGPVKFTSVGEVVEKDGKKVIQATYHYSYNGFDLGYDLTGVLKAGKLERAGLSANDFAEIDIRYTDDWLEAKGLTDKDVKGLIEQLNDPASKVRVGAVIIPGGEMLSFSPPMRKLLILGEKARAQLQACLGDERIQNEVALILGAVGDETTVPALIQAYPEGDLRKAKSDSPEYLKGVCLTFALTYLTGQPIGRSREGADLQPENKKLWKDWWAKEGKTFKVPSEKPNATWVPAYPILTVGWAARCREEFARGENRE
jgi:Carbohydrate family 9 binding domain-like